MRRHQEIMATTIVKKTLEDFRYTFNRPCMGNSTREIVAGITASSGEFGFLDNSVGQAESSLADAAAERHHERVEARRSVCILRPAQRACSPLCCSLCHGAILDLARLDIAGVNGSFQLLSAALAELDRNASCSNKARCF